MQIDCNYLTNYELRIYQKYNANFSNKLATAVSMGEPARLLTYEVEVVYVMNYLSILFVSNSLVTDS
jgi:hypothetical protein